MDKIKKEITIYDLAQRLGLSPSTISRALHNHHSIGKKTKEAVQELAKELGYRRNNMAANLRKQETNTIGVLVSRISQPFQARLISGVEEVAREAGYHVIISQSNDMLDAEKENVRVLYDSRVSGLVVSLAMESNDYGHFDLVIESNIPVVFVDRTPKDLACQRVVIDNFEAGYKATQHLIDQGCRRIAHVGGEVHQSIYEGRQGGYVKALEDNHLPVVESLIVNGKELSQQEGITLTEQLLGQNLPIDGIFYANDQAAGSAMQLLRQRGIDIPADMAIIGFNDDPICTLVDPPLSSITHPARQMGRIAAHRVIGIKEQQENIIQTVTLDTNLIARASSARLASIPASLQSRDR